MSLSKLEKYLAKTDADKGREVAAGFQEEFENWFRSEYRGPVPRIRGLELIRQGESLVDLTFSRIPSEIMEAWYNSRASVKAMESDPPYAPSWFLIQKPRHYDGWVIHLTDTPVQVATEGFTLGVKEPERLGVTRWLEDRKEEPGFNFGYALADWERYAPRSQDQLNGSFRYGQGAVVFPAKGVLIDHIGDKEPQVIFWGPSISPRKMVSIEKTARGWSAKGNLYPSLQEAVRTVTTDSTKRKNPMAKYPKYPYYIVHKVTGLIVGGADYKEDAIEIQRDLPLDMKDLSVLQAKTVMSRYGQIKWAKPDSFPGSPL